MIKEVIKNLIQEAGEKIGIQFENIYLEFPEVKDFGDYSTNVALVYAKKIGKNPRELAHEVLSEITKNLPEEIEKVEIAGSGFINFFLKESFYIKGILELQKEGIKKGNLLQSKKAIFEYTDPNPFKAFHIGHLMANAVGESLSRLAEFQGADVKRICYQGDIGIHVAKTIWAMKKAKVAFPHDDDSSLDKIKFMGDSYVVGVNAYEEDSVAQREIKEINKKLFEKSDFDLQVYYDKGREWSLLYFDQMYKKLDTHFDDFIFESEVSENAIKIIKENTPQVFTESEGAIVFKGENWGLHTRVFLNSQGLPTYEAKELANAKEKAKRHEFDFCVITSANEIDEYFKVVFKVMELIDPENARKTQFVSHGMLRFKEGKMSSRKGNIITGESLILDTEKDVYKKMENRDFGDEEKSAIASKVAIAAIKYTILKQSPGKDIIFDKEKALSFEGDSGPYLLYTLVRLNSLLQKAEEANISFTSITKKAFFGIEKDILKYETVFTESWNQKAPQKIVEYLIHLSSEFNSFYAKEKIVDKEDNTSGYKCVLVYTLKLVLEQGLNLLGIQSVERM